MATSRALTSQIRSRSLSSIATFTLPFRRNDSSTPCNHREMITTTASIQPSVFPTPPQRATMVTVTKTSTVTTANSLEGEPLAVSSNDNNKNMSSSIDNFVNEDMTITKSCIQQIQKLTQGRPHPEQVFLRVAVDPGGCSGFQYTFELEEEGIIDPDDDILYSLAEGAQVVVDRSTLDLIRGSTLDYVREMIRSSFAIVDNPHSESACGCGSSFAIKNFEENRAID